LNQGDAKCGAEIWRDFMKMVTIRNLPPHVVQAIRQRALNKRMSVNKAVISLLEECLNVPHRKPMALHHDLDNLAGSWTKNEASAFNKALTKQRAIDPDLWK
jgi:plasmid stability protein